MAVTKSGPAAPKAASPSPSLGPTAPGKVSKSTSKSKSKPKSNSKSTSTVAKKETSTRAPIVSVAFGTSPGQPLATPQWSPLTPVNPPPPTSTPAPVANPLPAGNFTHTQIPSVPTPEQVVKFLSIGPHWKTGVIKEFENHNLSDALIELGRYRPPFKIPIETAKKEVAVLEFPGDFTNAELFGRAEVPVGPDNGILYFGTAPQVTWVEKHLGLKDFDAIWFLDLLEDAIKGKFNGDE